MKKKKKDIVVSSEITSIRWWCQDEHAIAVGEMPWKMSVKLSAATDFG